MKVTFTPVAKICFRIHEMIILEPTHGIVFLPQTLTSAASSHLAVNRTVQTTMAVSTVLAVEGIVWIPMV